MISVREVHKSFGRVRAVQGVSFDLARGVVAGLLGPNGAGKSTTIRMITGFIPPDRGRVAIDGLDTLDQSLGARRCIGYLPESAPLYPEMNVEGYLTYRARLFGMTGRTRREAIERSIARCWLGPVRRRRVGHLSKGYRQRVGLASALLHDPPVLILDEPTNGLDPTQIVEMRKLVRELADGRTMLICSHILPEVELVCDRVIVIAGGTVRADGSPRDLLGRTEARSAHVVEAHLGDDAGDTALRAFGAAATPGTARLVRTLGDGFGLFHVEHPSPGVDLREAIARAAAQHGVLVRELRRERPTLESLFVRLVDDGHAAPPAPASPSEARQ